MFHLSKILSVTVFIILSLPLPYSAQGQQANEPKYQDGDWWRIKTALEVKDSSRRESCQDAYKEWLVKIDKAGLAHVYGVDGVKQAEASCNLILGWVFGSSDRKSLQFPLSVGRTWTHSYETGSRRRPTIVEPKYKVLSWEKVQTPKGTFDAFKISGTAKWVTNRGDDRYSNWTEYYSPKVKAIILYEGDSTAAKRKVKLVDFHLAAGVPTN